MTRDVTFNHQHNHTICNYPVAYGNAGGRVGVSIMAQGMGISSIVSGPQEFKINSVPQLKLRSEGEREKRHFLPKKLYACNLLLPHFFKHIARHFWYELGHWISITCCHPNQAKHSICMSLPGGSSLF